MKTKNNVKNEFSTPNSNISEAFRTLRTNIQFSMTVDNSSVILVTSSLQGEGKSWNSANVAYVFAAQGKKTLLIDADMRRGRQNEKFGISNANGLSNYLANLNFDDKKFIKTTSVENLFVVTAGNVPPNPSELLSSERMDDLINRAREEFDVVIVDGPPVLAVTDALILASKVDKIVLVVAANDTKKELVLSSKRALDNINAKISGVILNKSRISAKKYSRYGYGKYYKNDYVK